MMKATFGGGCFWCTEILFQQLKGIKAVIPGYMGGHVANPTYEEVCTGQTGHAEVIQIIFDPELIDFNHLLAIFFKTHDPTTLNRQGNDVGTQYRSVVFFHNETQQEQATALVNRLIKNKVYDAPITTEISAAGIFYEAEDYHHDYFNRNPNNPYCAAVIRPKLTAFLKEYIIS